MDVATVSMPEDEADKHYREYLEVVKTHKEKYLDDLKKVYYALKKGKKIIDIYEAFKKTGANEAGEPKLAISQADKKFVTFRKEIRGGGMFADEAGWQEKAVYVRLPAETFANWKDKDGNVAQQSYLIARKDIRTKVPLIPAHLMPEGDLSNYYLLWEVDEWQEIARAKDPFLLKRINANTFIVLAAWDLTEVEQIVMKGV